MWKIFLLSTLLILASYQECFAESQSVLISEIMWNGSSVSAYDEWVELYNPTLSTFDLAGWQIFDEEKAKTMVLIKEGKIPPKGYFLISNNPKDHKFSNGESILNIEPDLIDSDLSLSNEKLRISLKNTLGETIDTAGDGSKPFFSSSQNPKASISRRDDCADGGVETCWVLTDILENLDPGVLDFANPHNSGSLQIEDFRLKSPVILNNSDYLQFFIRLSGEPEKVEIFAGAELLGIDDDFSTLKRVSFDQCPQFTLQVTSKSGLKQTADYSAVCADLSNDIFISEAMPDPAEGEEWIEIANGGLKPVDLAGWYLVDASEKKYVLQNLIIDPLSFVLIYSGDSKIVLNNSSEKISLFDPLGNLIDSMEWESSHKGLSQSKWAGKIYESTIATPKGENHIESSKKPMSIEEKEELKDILGKKISAEFSNINQEKGFVTAEIFGKVAFLKTDQQLDIKQNYKYKIESLVESENPLIIRVLSFKIVDNEAQNIIENPSEKIYIKTTKTKITTKRKISKKKIKSVKSLERPPNGFKNSEIMVKLLVVITFCYCGVIYGIYSKERTTINRKDLANN